MPARRLPKGPDKERAKPQYVNLGPTEHLRRLEGETVIDNAAREPEIVDLCTMLARMGARISGAGTSVLTIEGVQKLAPTTHRVIGDRIVAATWGIAAAMTQGDGAAMTRDTGVAAAQRTGTAVP